MEYMNIGTSRILEEYFYPVVNSDKIIKPAGGFWCTDYLSNYYNEWVDFITSNPNYFVRYMGEKDPFLLSGAVVSLKPSSRIFRLDNSESFAELEGKYKFDFEKLTEDYDAISFDILGMFDSSPKLIHDIRRLISVDTMLLFNLGIIDGYRKATVAVEPFDYTFDACDELSMEINVGKDIFQVEEESIDYKQLLEDISKDLQDFIFHLRLDNPSVPSYVLVDTIKKEIMRIYSEEIKAYTTSKGYDDFRISNSIAIKAYRKIK